MNEITIAIEPQLPDVGICMVAPASEIHSGDIYTVKGTPHTIYTVVESAVNSFTTVVYGLIRHLPNRVRQLCKFFRNERFRSCGRIAKLAYAGGLRL